MPFYIRVTSLITPVHCITKTEEPELLREGISKEDIVLAFYDLETRKLTGFAVS